jgi:Protein of unknown function (DUF3435)
VLYSLKVPPGQGQLRVPWKENMDDVYLFRKPERTAIGVELSDEQLPYHTLRQCLLKVGELTNFELPLGAYGWRRGNGEGLNSSSKLKSVQAAILVHNQFVQVISRLINVISASGMRLTPLFFRPTISLTTSLQTRMRRIETSLHRRLSFVLLLG